MENASRIVLALMALAMLALAACAPAPTPVPTSAPAATPTRTPAPAPTAAATIPAVVVPPNDPGGLIATRAFEVVASGAPASAPANAKPLMVALRAGSPVPPQLPDEARQALTTAVAVQDDALYLVVYVGPQPSAGYSVRIVSVAPSVVGGVTKVSVMYLVERPDPSKGAATVMTHPYVIVRVRGLAVDPANVTFQPQ